MRAFRVLGFLLAAASLLGCSSKGGIITFPLEGTETAVVRIALDENKIPRVIEETVVIEVGQRIVWVGPQDFMIRFPNGSPFDGDNFTSKEAVISLEVPEKSQQFFRKGKKRIKFKYDVVVGDRVLDPHVILIEK